MLAIFTDYIALPLIAFLPSLIWLVFYYKKDKHPEPRGLVVKIFLWGMLLALPVYLLEIAFLMVFRPGTTVEQILNSPLPAYLYLFLIFLVGPIVEEALKLGIVRFHFLKNPAFDEPSDIMVYCVIGGLGFAGVENLIYAWQEPFFLNALAVVGLRAVSSTLLHATAAAIAGYWLALSLKRNRSKLTLWGLAVAVVLHSCYNYFIWQKSAAVTAAGQGLSLVFVFALLLAMALAVSWQFERLNKEKSVCQTANSSNN